MGEVLERSGGDGGAPPCGANLLVFLGGESVIRGPHPPAGTSPMKNGGRIFVVLIRNIYGYKCP